MVGIARIAIFGAAGLALGGWLNGTADAAGPSPEPGRICLSGDTLFRHSKFEEAERTYATALAADPASARAHWGLGRIAALTGRATAAREHFLAAYRLDPRDPEILLAYADQVSDLAARRVLLRNYLMLGKDTDPQRREDVLARLQVAERLGGRQPGKLASPYQHYRFTLSAFFPDSQAQRGVLLPVRVNGGKPLRLVLDSGAEGIVLNASRGRDVSLTTLASSRLNGLGDAEGVPARVVLADSVSIGAFQVDNCVIQVAERDVVPGADGVIGLELFQDFLLRLDLRKHTFDLIPFAAPTEPAAELLPPAAIYRLSHMILLRAPLDGETGYFLLDTGSSFSAVARHATGREAVLLETTLRGPTREFPAALRLPPLALAFAGTRLVDEHPVALDLASMSQAAGAEIAGIAGYPLFRRSAFLLDYRAGSIQFEK